jgi:hypothetical protein
MQVGYTYQIVPFVRVYPVRRHIHSRGCFYPAAGNRYITTGVLTGVGLDGYYWSSSPSSVSNGYDLLFSSSSVYPSYSAARSYGFLARCIAEFMTVFLHGWYCRFKI